MIPSGAVRYVLISAIIVTSLFLGLRCIFAHDLRREAWRSAIKHRIYIPRQRFKILTIILGFVLLSIALYLSYQQVINLMAD